MAAQSWTRYVAIGDSFTEGVGDPDPARPGELRGWADRVAEVLAAGNPGFGYANLAVRGKLMRQILDDQIEPAVRLDPDLVTISGGGNDVIRPGTDPDRIAELMDRALARLKTTGATIVLFTGVDVGFSGTFRAIRGKVAVYNENLRALAEKHGCLVADQWGLAEIRDVSMWSIDRLHLSPLGHQNVARKVLDVLGVPHTLTAAAPLPAPELGWRERRSNDLEWAREYALPWVGRRLRGVSSGDNRAAKRPTIAPIS